MFQQDRHLQTTKLQGHKIKITFKICTSHLWKKKWIERAVELVTNIAVCVCVCVCVHACVCASM